MRFKDRTDAGRQLGDALRDLELVDPIVVALPRGGVPIGYEVAFALEAPLDVLVARKLGAPGHTELGIGAIAEGSAIYLNEPLILQLGVPRAYLAHVERMELAEIARRVRVYRGARPPVDVHGRTVVLVDDGLATGVTTRAAIRALRLRAPDRIVLAVPVGARETVEEISTEVDEVVCLLEPDDFYAVGVWYENFEQTTDDEVIALLERASHEHPPGGPGIPTLPRGPWHPIGPTMGGTRR